jgi:SAM-dependent methyltransferase
VVNDHRDALRVAPDDPDYRRLAAAEAAYWERPHPLGLETWERRTRFDNAVDRYTNERFTGDPRVSWEATICRHGRFRRGLVLGTSMLGVEANLLATNPDLAVTFVDLSEGALERRRATLGARFPGRVTTRVGDLNFLEIEPGAYDCIVSQASLHHVVNIEYLALQVNRGLAPGGRFFLQDYVGEKRFQFREEKKRVFAEIYRREARHHPGRDSELRWRDPSDLSPFCGVRSDEVLGVLRAYLHEESVRTAGALTVPGLRAQPVDGDWPDPRSAIQRARDAVTARFARMIGRAAPSSLHASAEFVEGLTVLGDLLADAGLLVPGNAFAIYRAR